MKLFGTKSADEPSSPKRRPPHRRSFRTTFITFCVALLLESIAMQLLTQISTTDQPQASSHVLAKATGSVATPTPTPRLGLSSVVAPVLASVPVEPETVAVIFHSPLRSYRLTQYFHGGHPAIDMAAVTGTPIYASTVGTVSATGYVLEGGGLMVKVDHPNGFTSYYAHMSAITSKVGQHVDNQSQIGKVGMTGWATGPHLHFMLVNNKGVSVNPLSYIK